MALPGFKKYVRTGVTVQELQITRVDVMLAIGSAAESVTVTDVASPEDGDWRCKHKRQLQHGQRSSGRLDRRHPENTLTVAQMIPGTNATSLSSLRINGTPVNSEQVRIDGLDATYSLGAMPTIRFASPSVDAIQESRGTNQ